MRTLETVAHEEHQGRRFIYRRWGVGMLFKSLKDCPQEEERYKTMPRNENRGQWAKGIK